MKRALLTLALLLVAVPTWAQSGLGTRANDTLKRMFTIAGHFGFPPAAADPFACTAQTRRATYYNTTTNLALFCNGTAWTGLGGAGTGTANDWTATQTFSNATLGAIFSSSGGSGARFNNGVAALFGNAENASIWFSTIQTPDSWVFGVPALSNSVIFAERGDIAFDFAVALQTNPTVVIPSATQSVEQRMFLAHNQTQGLVQDGANTAANRRPIGLQGGSAVASATTITPTGNVFHVTGTTSITGMTAMASGTCVTLIFDAALTFTDGAGTLRLAGNFVTTADDTIALCCDGTNWFEHGRAIN